MKRFTACSAPLLRVIIMSRIHHRKESGHESGANSGQVEAAARQGSSLACVHPTRMSVVSQHRAGEDVKKPAPQDTQTRSRLLIGQNGPSDSALAASSGWQLLAAQPLTGTLRAALLGACARACVPRRYTPSNERLSSEN